MRIAIRIALGLVVVVLIGLGALAAFLPSLVKSDAVRARIETAARDALGRDVRYADLDFALLPPSLVVMKPAVAGATPEAPPFATADEVALRVALAPLLRRAVVVDSFVIEGATVRLVRTAEGIELPQGKGAEKSPEKPAPEPDAGASAPVDLAIRGLELRNTTLILEDRAVSPPVTWELRDVDATLRGDSLDEPFEIGISAQLASGGRLSTKGTATLDGQLDLALDLDALALAPVRPYLTGVSELVGLLSGRVEVKGPAANPTKLAVRADLRDARIAQEEIVVRGAVGVVADLAGGLETPQGTFDLDATKAELRYGEVFTKPVGTQATISGRVTTDKDGTLGLDLQKLRMKNLDAEAKVKLGERTRVTAEVRPFDLAGWDEIVPALAGYQLSGPAAFEALSVVTAPLEVRGRIRLKDVAATLPDQGAVKLTGDIVAEGDSIRTDGFTMKAAEQTFSVDGTVRNLAGNPTYRVRLDAEKADTNALVSTFAQKRDAIYGPLNLEGDISGSLGGPKSPLETVNGKLRFDITDGRLVGVSLLKATFDQLGALGKVAEIAAQFGKIFGGRDLQRFYGDEFKALKGTLDIGGGIARTNDFRLEYRHYAVDLWGTLGLTDLALDMQGKLTIDKEVDQVLAAEAQGAQPAKSRVIPLAAVKGTLDSPRVTLTAETIRTFAANYTFGLDRVIDKQLGEGAGKAVTDILQGVLGGGRRQ